MTPPKVIGTFAQYTGANQGADPANIPWGCSAWSPELGVLVMLSAFDGTGTVVAADFPAAQSSENGTAFTVRSIPADIGPSGRAWVACAWLPFVRKFAAVGYYFDAGSDERFLTCAYSDDGVTWALGSISGLSGDLNDANGEPYYEDRVGIAVSSDRAVFSSVVKRNTVNDYTFYSLVTTNGTSWTAVAMNAIASQDGGNLPTRPAYVATEGLFVAYGYNADASLAVRYTSANAVSWTVTVTALDDGIFGVLFNAATGEIVVYGEDGAGSGGVVLVGTALASLTRTTVAQFNKFSVMYYFGPNVGYYASQFTASGQSDEWAQSDDVTVWAAPVAVGQEQTFNATYIPPLNFVILGCTDGTPLTGGTISRATVSGTAVDTVNGFWALNGQEVSVTLDGTVLASPNNPAYDTTIVVDGAIEVPLGSTGTLTVGLPYVSDIQTLDIDAAVTTVKDRDQFSGGVIAWVRDTAPFWAGPAEPSTATSVAELERIIPVDENWDAVAEQAEGTVQGVTLATWNKTGRVWLRQVDPVPMTILGISPQGTTGGR